MKTKQRVPDIHSAQPFRLFSAVVTIALTVASTLTIAVTLGACGSGQAETEPATTTTPSDTATHTTVGTTPELQNPDDTTFTASPPPAAELAIDTIPVRSPGGAPVRFGLHSGRVHMVYKGDLSGTRTILFDNYGMRERRTDLSRPSSSDAPGAAKSLLFISTPEFYGEIDGRTRIGWEVPNTSDDRYLASSESESTPFGELVLARSGGTRKADTTINGYHTRTYQVTTPNFIRTIWVWRGVAIREEVTSKQQGMNYRVEPVAIEELVSVPDSMFVFPAGYNIQERPEPMPGQVVPAPNTPAKSPGK